MRMLRQIQIPTIFFAEKISRHALDKGPKSRSALDDEENYLCPFQELGSGTL
jgi:hypothetical protein